jgi:hypothetical protein
MRNAYKFLVGRPEGKGPLVRHRCIWKDNIKTEEIDVKDLVIDDIKLYLIEIGMRV